MAAQIDNGQLQGFFDHGGLDAEGQIGISYQDDLWFVNAAKSLDFVLNSTGVFALELGSSPEECDRKQECCDDQAA
jgi:hypothetical protein